MHVHSAGGLTGYFSRTCGMLTKSKTGMLWPNLCSTSYKRLMGVLWSKAKCYTCLGEHIVQLHLSYMTQEVTKLMIWHHCRDSGVILLASGGVGMELLQIWGNSDVFSHDYSAPLPVHRYVSLWCALWCTLDINTYLLSRTLGQREFGAGLNREEPPGSITSICYCQWLGAV